SSTIRNATAGHEQKYGYWESRIKIPRSKSFWGAFWLTGGSNANGFGEIDIFETVAEPFMIHQNIHNWSLDGVAHVADGTVALVPFDYAADFHVYGLLWTADEIVWYIDGKESKRALAPMVATFRDLCGPLHVLINLAIGGSWAGSPDGTTVWPGIMEIDYIKVWSV
ncbi:MAG TPA: glycoside hydrolase family 16 protein, partial [Abditibacteriaceae bacterium]